MKNKHISVYTVHLHKASVYKEAISLFALFLWLCFTVVFTDCVICITLSASFSLLPTDMIKISSQLSLSIKEPQPWCCMLCCFSSVIKEEWAALVSKQENQMNEPKTHCIWYKLENVFSYFWEENKELISVCGTTGGKAEKEDFGRWEGQRTLKTLVCLKQTACWLLEQCLNPATPLPFLCWNLGVSCLTTFITFRNSDWPVLFFQYSRNYYCNFTRDDHHDCLVFFFFLKVRERLWLWQINYG